MFSVREIPLPQESLRVLEDLVAASPEHPASLWQRVKAAATLFDRKFLMDRAAEARAALSRGVCDEVRVRHDAPPVIAEHEHGLFLFVAVDAGHTLLLDVSSVSDDARWTAHRAGNLLCAQWRWLRFKDLDGTWCFAAEGNPVAPRNLGDFHGTALERRLTEEMDWPGDAAVLPLPLAEIERLAHQRVGKQATHG